MTKEDALFFLGRFRTKEINEKLYDALGVAIEALNAQTEQPEPCKEVQHILDYLDNVLHPLVSPEHWNIYSELHDMIAALPSAQPERKTGKWEYHSNPNIRGGMNPEDAYCSACGFHIYTPEVDNFDDYNFCPNCGTRLMQEGESNDK